MVVRVVLSHVMQPSASPGRTADDIAWVAARVLRPAGSQAPGWVKPCFTTGPYQLANQKSARAT